MDVLTIILRTVRETIESTGAPPDGLQDALAAAEARLRRSVGGSAHHISRAPQQLAKQRIVELAEQGLQPSVIRDRTGVSETYVYRVLRTLRRIPRP